MSDYFLSNDPGSKVEVRIDGVAAAVEVLKTLEFAIRRRVVSAAVRAANAVIVREARQLAPVGATGLLKKQMRGTVKMQRASGIVYGTIRSGATKAMRKKGVKTAARYAHLVIGGTKPHSIQQGDQGPMLALPGGWYTRLWHPGAKPRPFMEQAANMAFQQAINAFEFKMDEALAKEIAKARKSGAAAVAAMV